VHDQLYARGQSLKTFFSPSSYQDPFPSLPPRRQFRLDPHTILLALILVVLGAMGYAFFNTLRPVEIVIGNTPRTIWTNQTTVAGVLHEAAIELASNDIVFPDQSEPIPEDQPISIELAQPLTIHLGDQVIFHRTQSSSIADALGEVGILLEPRDGVWLNGIRVNQQTKLLRAVSDNANDPSVMQQVIVERAVPIQIDDDGYVSTFYTTAPTLGEALNQAGLLVYLGDYIRPELGTQVEPGYQVYIRRSRPLNISVDGKIIHTRSRADVVQKLLAEEGIQLSGKDYSVPDVKTPLADGMTVQVMRVREESLIETEAIPFETQWQADPTTEIDDRDVVQAGVEGVKKRSILIRYENGREVRRTIDREWVDAVPTTKIINYGTKLVHHDLTLSDGSTISYWRKIRLHATSYTAATSGKARSHPYYGVTYTGMQAGFGVVAVDPKIINLRAKLYVPGYGPAIAGDTGGRIKGLRIDLGYDESNLVLWYKWVDAYLLDPPPPPDQIHYILPDVPRSAQSNGR
jgi:resuscitation-promoting factor RpfB